jgi:hypothetical protein
MLFPFFLLFSSLEVHWDGLGRFWDGFGTVWDGFGTVLGRFWDGFVFHILLNIQSLEQTSHKITKLEIYFFHFFS